MHEKIKEVEILGEGFQLVQLATKKHRISKEGLVKKYAEKTGNYEKSINSYFDNKVLKIEKFKSFLEKDLGKPYHKLIRTVEDQLKTYIEGIRDNIYLYNDGEDNIVLNKLLEETRYYKMPYLEVIALGNFGRFKVNLRLNEEAKTILQEAIDKAMKQAYWDLVVYYHTNMAYVENLEGKHPDARKRLKAMVTFLENHPVDNKMVLHKFWYTYGITMQMVNLLSSSRKKFEKAMEYAETADDEIRCFINIAMLYEMEEKYNDALETYDKALKVCYRNSHLKVTVLNNIANFYIATGDIERAKEYINKAIALMPKDLNINRKIAIFDTYLTLEEDCDKIMEDLLQSLRETSKITENRYYVYKCIDAFVGKLKRGKRYRELRQLAGALMEQIEREVKEEDIKEFEARFGNIAMLLIKEGGYRLEEKNSPNGSISPID